VATPAKKRRRYPRAVYGTEDRRFPKRDPEVEAMYPGHLLPASPQMLEELLQLSLEARANHLRARRLVVWRVAA
jgi:hypothetical protein